MVTHLYSPDFLLASIGIYTQGTSILPVKTLPERSASLKVRTPTNILRPKTGNDKYFHCLEGLVEWRINYKTVSPGHSSS